MLRNIIFTSALIACLHTTAQDDVVAEVKTLLQPEPVSMTSVRTADGHYVLRDIGRNIITLNGSTDQIGEKLYLKYQDLNEVDYYRTLIGLCPDFVSDSPEFPCGPYESRYNRVDYWDNGRFSKYGFVEASLCEYSDDGTTSVTVHTTGILPIKDKATALRLDMGGTVLHEGRRYELRFSYRNNADDAEAADVYCIDAPYVADSYRLSGSPLIMIRGGLASMQPALDVHWGMQQVYDFYLEHFGLDSYDGKGSPIYNIVNASQEAWMQGYTESYAADNSFAADLPGASHMIFGMGCGYPGRQDYPLVSLAAMGHEYTHLVSNRLDYVGESAALYESYADIMGIAIEHEKSHQPYSWHFGWEICRENNLEFDGELVDFRCFSNPERNGHPSCYRQPGYWNASGNVHYNASVQNHAYYLLVEGGEGINALGTPYSVTAIDEDQAVAIFFRALTEYGVGTLSFAKARDNAVRSAAELYGEDSQPVRSVMDAWHAVGVGQSYAEATAVLPVELDGTSGAADVYYDLYGRRLTHAASGTILIDANGKRLLVK